MDETLYKPAIGEEVELTEGCPPYNLKAGDVIKVVDYKDGMASFDLPNFNLRGWTSKFKAKSKGCTCNINDLLIRGCTCGGK